MPRYILCFCLKWFVLNLSNFNNSLISPSCHQLGHMGTFPSNYMIVSTGIPCISREWQRHGDADGSGYIVIRAIDTLHTYKCVPKTQFSSAH